MVKDAATSLAIAVCGCLTSVVTAVAVVEASKLTGYDLFTFSLWVVVPVGALLTGFAAASGYYFGSLYFHKRAGLALLVQMVVTAGLTQLLIYYLSYQTFVLEDGRQVSELVPFANYLAITLTSAHYRIGRALTDTGEVGTFGYWLAALQFLGFLAGGLSVFGFLRAKPVCGKCNFYLRALKKHQRVFADSDSATQYYDNVFRHPVDGPDFAAAIRLDSKAKAQKGAVLVNTILHGCPKCKSQMIEEKVQVYNGSDWKDASKLDRRVPIPDGVDLLPVFNA